MHCTSTQFFACYFNFSHWNKFLKYNCLIKRHDQFEIWYVLHYYLFWDVFYLIVYGMLKLLVTFILLLGKHCNFSNFKCRMCPYSTSQPGCHYYSAKWIIVIVPKQWESGSTYSCRCSTRQWENCLWWIWSTDQKYGPGKNMFSF